MYRSRQVVCSISLVFFAIGMAAVAKAQDSALFPPAEMVADLTRFRDALRGAHPGLSERGPAREFDEFFAKLLAEVQRPRKPVDFYRVVFRLTARLHDGHTRAFANGDLRSWIAKQGLLPMHVTLQNGRIFVLRNLSDAAFADGSEILSIDGVPSGSILARLTDYVGVDGASESGIRYRLGGNYNSFYRLYPLVFGFTAHQVVLRDHATGGIATVSLAQIASAEFQAREQARYGSLLHTWSLEAQLAHAPLTLRIEKDSGYAVLTISRFFNESFDEGAEIFPSLLSDAFRQIAEAGIGRLIIDLRGNGGGDGANVGHLVSWLVDRPFTPTTRITFRGNDAYYRNFTQDTLGLDDYFGLRSADKGFVVTRVDRIRELGVFLPAAMPYRGKVAVLIDGGTVSAAGMAAGLLRERTRAIFVGEEAGGYSGMSNGIRQLSVVGARTQTGINFPLAHSEFAVRSRIAKRGVVPDYAVTNSIDDLLAGRDAVLKRAVLSLR